MIIRRVDPVSLGKIQAFVGAAFGFLVAIMWAGMMAIGGMAAGGFGGVRGGGGPPAGAGVVMGAFAVGAVIGMPMMYALMGFISGLIGGFVFNLAAGMIGGLEIEVDLQDELLDQDA